MAGVVRATPPGRVLKGLTSIAQQHFTLFSSLASLIAVPTSGYTLNDFGHTSLCTIFRPCSRWKCKSEAFHQFVCAAYQVVGY